MDLQFLAWKFFIWSSFMTGDTLCSAFSRLSLLLAGCSSQNTRWYMDRNPNSWFWTEKHLARVHLFHVLVNCHPRDSWLWRLACREYRREDFYYILHAFQHWPHSLSNWKHDKSYCSQCYANLRIGKSSLKTFHISTISYLSPKQQLISNSSDTSHQHYVTNNYY